MTGFELYNICNWSFYWTRTNKTHKNLQRFIQNINQNMECNYSPRMWFNIIDKHALLKKVQLKSKISFKYV